MPSPLVNTRRRALGLIAAAVAAPQQALAQAAPAQALRWVVPFPPGGLLDSVARIIGPRLGAALNQPVMIENKAGSGGNIGADLVAKATADGQTLLMGSPGLTISPHLYKKLPFALDDLAPVALLGSTANVLLVPRDSPARTVQELVALLRANPGKHMYASNGNGTSLHLSAELLKFRTRSFVVHVPYRGSAPAMNALLAGEVHLMFDNLPPALPHIQSGRVRALAVTSASRSPALPDVPTLKEAGVPDFEVSAWFGLMAPKATPEPVLKRLQAACAEAMQDADVLQALRKQATEPRFQGAAAFAKHLAREHGQWKDVVGYAKIVLD